MSVSGNLNIGTNGDGTADGQGTGTYAMSGGTLTVNNAGYFGNNGGTGTFNQTGGTAQFGTPSNSGGLQLGTTPLFGPASTGTYNILSTYYSVNKVFISSSSSPLYGNVDLGVAANTTGNMTIGTLGLDGLGDPTTVTISSTGGGDGNLTVGDAGNGNLTIHSGTLTVANTTQVGVNGVGTVLQDGGSFTTGVLDLSTPSFTGSSTYNMEGGSLETTSDLNVGQGEPGFVAGPATFSQTGGTVQVDGNLFDGNFSHNATYNLGGTGELTLTNGDLIVGNNTDTKGTFNFNTASGDGATLGFTGTNQGLHSGRFRHRHFQRR